MILRAKRRVYRTHRKKRNLCESNSTAVLEQHRVAKRQYRQAVRRSQVLAGIERDRKLFEILADNPRKAYSFIKSSRRAAPNRIESLTVSDKVYTGNSVRDGLYVIHQVM